MDNLFCRRSLLAFWLVLAILAGLIFGFRLDAMVRQGPYFCTTGIEDMPIFTVSRMQYGDPVYADCFTYPYRASMYNWLFFQMHGAVAAIMQPSEVELPTVLRFITLAWTVAGFFALLVFLQSKAVMSISLAAVAWFAPIVGWWSMTVRPDIPAVVCEFIAFALVARGSSRLSAPRAILTGLLFFAAWSFKPSAVGILAGTLGALLLRREWFNLLVIAATFSAPTAMVLLLASPEYYANQFEGPRLATFSLGQLAPILFWCAVQWGPLLAMAPVLLLGMSSSARQQFVQSRPIQLLGVVLAASVMMNLLAATRVGCSPNYFFETWLIGMALTGLLSLDASRDPEAMTSPIARLVFASFMLLLLLFIGKWSLPLFDPLDKPDTMPREVMVRLPRPPYAPELLEAIRTSPRPILCDDSFLLRQALGADTAGLPVLDLPLYGDMQRAERLSQPDVDERIAKGEYVNIWLFVRMSEWEKRVLAAGYVPVWEDGLIRQYRRAGGASPP